MVPPEPRHTTRVVRRSRVGGWPIAIVGIFLVLLAYELRYTLVPFVFAAVIGFVLEPVVRWCADRTGGRRWPVSTLLTLLILGLVLGGGYFVGEQSARELSATVKRLPEMLHQMLTALIGPNGITLFGAHYTPQELVALIINGATNLISSAQIFLAIQIGVGVIAAVILTLVLIPYFLVSGPTIAEGIIWLVPPERRRSIEEMLPILVPVLRRYVVGLFCVVIYAAVLIYIALGPIFGVPGAPLLAIVIGLLELVPVVGPITSLILVALAAFSQGGFTDIFLMVYAVVLRLSIDNFIGPLLLGKSARVHPVVVIFGFIVGAMLFGVIGLLLAVPVAASIRIILQYYYSEPIARGGEAEPEVVEVRGRLDSQAARP